MTARGSNRTCVDITCVYKFIMTTTAILKQLPKLTPKERAEIQAQLDELAAPGWQDADDPLSEADNKLIEERAAAHEKNPKSAISWSKFDAKLKRRLSK